MGSGAIEGVAGPEAANNAAAQTAFIPTLSLGIPGSPTMALMLGAMVMHNIQPGPRVMTSNPDLFWGLIVSMLIGNLMLVILNLPLVGLWVRLLKIPYRALFPRSEEHTYELQSLMRILYDVFCMNKYTITLLYLYI